MVELGNLSQMLSVRGTNKGNPRIFAVAPPWGIHCAYHMVAMKPLENEYTFLCLTPVGNSPSQRPVNPLDISVTQSTADLERLRKWLHLDAIHVQGHSAGGSTALLYAEEYPTHVASLTLIEACLEDYNDSATFFEFSGRVFQGSAI